MKTRTSLVILVTLGLLASCAQMNSQLMDMSQAAQEAKTRPDHFALAKRYEDAAKEMQEKVQEVPQLSLW
jgi:hypothetical protein